MLWKCSVLLLFFCCCSTHCHSVHLISYMKCINITKLLCQSIYFWIKEELCSSKWSHHSKKRKKNSFLLKRTTQTHLFAYFYLKIYAFDFKMPSNKTTDFDSFDCELRWNRWIFHKLDMPFVIPNWKSELKYLLTIDSFFSLVVCLIGWRQ